MTSAAALNLDNLKNLRNDDLLSKVSAPVLNVIAPINLGETTFSFTESLESKNASNPIAAILDEHIVRVWLDSGSNHVSISSGNGTTNIRVINGQSGSAQIADILKLDDAPKSIAISPNGNDFLVISEEGVFQYSVLPEGKLKLTFNYYSENVKSASYHEEGVKIVIND